MKRFAYVSQPMNKDYAEIRKERGILEARLRDMGYEVINTFYSSLVPMDVKNMPICQLGSNLIRLADADIAVFMKGWNKSRGCRLEHHACKLYDMPILYENNIK